MKLPMLTDNVNCINQVHTEQVEFPAGEGFVLFRKEGEETIAAFICSACGAGAREIGIPVQATKLLIELSDGRQQYKDEDSYAIELFDINLREKSDLYAETMYACETPLCDSPPERATSMSALILKEGEVEKVVPICKTKCTGEARAAGLKVSDLHTTIERFAREAKGALRFKQDQARKKVVGEFFTKFVKADPREVRTAPVHQTGAGLGNSPRLSGRK